MNLSKEDGHIGVTGFWLFMAIALIFYFCLVSIGISANDEYNQARHQICKDYGAADYDERMGACYKMENGHRVRVYQLKEGQYTDLYRRNAY